MLHENTWQEIAKRFSAFWFLFWLPYTLQRLYVRSISIPRLFIPILLYLIGSLLTTLIMSMAAIVIPGDYEKYLWWILQVAIYVWGFVVHNNTDKTLDEKIPQMVIFTMIFVHLIKSLWGMYIIS